MISSCLTLAAPKRTAVPIQSLPVSPPPMTRTCLPSSVGPSFLLSEARTFLVVSVKKSTAKRTPDR